MEIAAWAEEHFHKSLCRPQTHDKDPSCTEEALCEHDHIKKALLSSLVVKPHCIYIYILNNNIM